MSDDQNNPPHEQMIINRMNIKALNEAFKRSEIARNELQEKVTGQQRTITMQQSEVAALTQRVAALYGMLHNGGSTA